MITAQQLICDPLGEGLKQNPRSLSLDLLQQFIEMKIVAPSDLTTPMGDAPLWYRWYKRNLQQDRSAQFLYEMLPTLPDFSWADVFGEKRLNSPLEALGKHLRADQVEKVLKGLSSSELTQMQELSYDNPLAFGCTKAVLWENPQLLEVLIQKGWDINRPNAKGKTLIMQCAKWKDAQMLLAHNPNLDVVAADKSTILDCARQWSSDNSEFNAIVKVLQSHQAPPTNEFEKSSNSVFAVLASQRASDLKKHLKKFDEISIQPNETLKDNQGRSPLKVLIDTFASTKQSRNPEFRRFFVRFLNAFIPYAENKPWCNTQTPHTLAHWTERDHVLMLTCVSAADKSSFPTSLVAPPLAKEIYSWLDNRLPQLENTLAQWFEAHLITCWNNTSDRDSETLNKAWGDFFRKGSHYTPAEYTHKLIEKMLTTPEGSPLFNLMFESLFARPNTWEGYRNAQTQTPGHWRAHSYPASITETALRWACNNPSVNNAATKRALACCALDEINSMYGYNSSDFKEDEDFAVFVQTTLTTWLNEFPDLRGQWLAEWDADIQSGSLEFPSPNSDVPPVFDAFIQKQCLLRSMPTQEKPQCPRKM